MKNKILLIPVVAAALGVTLAVGLPLTVVEFTVGALSALLGAAQDRISDLKRLVYRRSVGPLMALADRLAK